MRTFDLIPSGSSTPKWITGNQVLTVPVCVHLRNILIHAGLLKQVPSPVNGHVSPQLGCSHWIYFFKDFIYLFLERGEGREKERERNINVWLPLMHPQLGTWPTTQACSLTGNRLATFRSQASAQSTEQDKSGLNLWWYLIVVIICCTDQENEETPCLTSLLKFDKSQCQELIILT